MPKMGHITVITGPMRGRKSFMLIDRLQYAQYAEKRVLAFKPKIDNRNGPTLRSRKFDKEGKATTFLEFPAKIIEKPEDVLTRVELVQPELIGIDEAQFLSKEIADLVGQLAQRGINFMIAGLDLDYLRQPFGAMPHLMALADHIEKTFAICYRCKSEQARFTQKIGGSTNQVEVGDSDLYRAACGDCWYPYRGEAS